MPDLAELIETIHQQQLRDEERLRDLESQAADTRQDIATAKEEIAQLLIALEIAVKRGLAGAEDLDIVQELLAQGQEVHPLVGDAQEPQPPLSDAQLAEPSDRSRIVPVGFTTKEEEEEEEEEERTLPAPPPAPRVRKSLIDTVYDIIQDLDGEFTTTDVRKELAKRYPEMFVSINPASVSGTVARLYKEYDCGLERVGEYSDGIHYRRKVKTETKEEDTAMIPTTQTP